MCTCTHALLSLSPSLSVSLSLCLSLSLSLCLSVSLCLCLSASVCLSLSRSLARACTHTLYLTTMFALRAGTESSAARDSSKASRDLRGGPRPVSNQKGRGWPTSSRSTSSGRPRPPSLPSTITLPPTLAAPPPSFGNGHGSTAAQDAREHRAKRREYGVPEMVAACAGHDYHRQLHAVRGRRPAGLRFRGGGGMQVLSVDRQKHSDRRQDEQRDDPSPCVSRAHARCRAYAFKTGL